MWVYPLAATAVSALCSGAVFRQYRQGCKPYQLAWAVALALFALASLAELLALAAGWNAFLVKVYYLFGATLVVGWLALGTVYLLAPRSAPYVLGALALASLLALGAVAGAAVDPARLAEGYPALERPPLLRAITVGLNGLGTLVLVGGALISGWQAWRRRGDSERAVANGLIALGVLVVATGGTLSGLAGLAGPGLISVTNALGVTILFLGVRRAGRTARPAAPDPEPGG